MDFGQLKRAVTGHLLQEGSTAYFDEKARDLAIQEAYLEVSTEHELYTVKATGNVVVTGSPATIPFPTDFLTLANEGLWVGGRPLTGLSYEGFIFADPEQTDLVNRDTGQPKFFTIRDREATPSIMVLPFPDATYGYALYYNAVPPVIASDSDQPWAGRFPQHHKLIAYLAARNLWRDHPNDSGMGRSRFWQSEYDREKAAITREKARNNFNRVRLGLGYANSRTTRRGDPDAGK